MPLRRYIFALIVLILSAISLSTGYKSYAVLCAPNECGPGWYVCGSGYQTYDMCCWGSTGCPSFECNSIPSGYDNCWATNVNTASGEYTCRCVKETCTTFPAYCSRWSSVYECGCNHWVTEYYSYICNTYCYLCPPGLPCGDYPCRTTCTGTRQVCDEPEYCRDCLTWTTPPPECTYDFTQTQYLALGACYYCTGDETPGYVPPPLFACEEPPSAPGLIFPANNDTLYRSSPMRVRHEWSLPTNWGKDCSAVSMTLQVDNESSFTNPRTYDVTHNASTVSAEVTYPSQGTYYWRVQACNNKDCRYSSPFTFNLVCGIAPQSAQEESPLSGTQDVDFPTVVTWEDPSNWGSTCNNINTNTVSVYFRTKTSATCDAPGPLYSIAPGCQNLPEGTESCTIPTANNTEYCWYLQTSNGQMSALSATTGSDVWWFETDDPLIYQNWITSIGGSASVGGNLFMNFPDDIDQKDPWKPPYFVYESADATPVSLTTFLDVEFEDAGEKSEPDFWAENINAGQTWPMSYTGNSPTTNDLRTLTGNNCSEAFDRDDLLFPDKVYIGDVSCVNEAISSIRLHNPGYRLAEEGVVTVYVTGNGNLNFENNFTTVDKNFRIVFVTGPEVEVVIGRALNVDETLGTIDKDEEPLIQAAFVVSKNMMFDGVTLLPIDPETDPDGTVALEGPIIAQSVEFNRSRVLGNAYPSEMIIYNPKYLYDLTVQERTSGMANYTGLFTMDVTWEIAE